MKTTHKFGQRSKVSAPLFQQSTERQAALRELVAKVKRTVLDDYTDLTGEHTGILKLALNEAEALAWDTNFPELFYPALAKEKAESALTWHRRQRSVRRTAAQLAFAE